MVAAERQGISSPDLAEFFKQVKQAGPEYERRIKREIKAGGQDAVQAAKRGGSFSSRLPGSVSLMVRTTGKRAGVLVTQSRKKAPHGRPLENDGQRGVFFHPVYGISRTVIPAVPQQARPWFFSSIQPVAARTATRIEGIVDEVSRELGFT